MDECGHKGEYEMERRKRKKREQLPFRVNILFFIIFLLFSVLILQLGIVQILNGEDFQKEIERTIEDTTKIPVPRGLIYDRNYNVIVDNQPVYSITYTPAKGTQAEERLEVAEKLAKLIDMDEEAIEKLSERNLKEYWYLKNKKKADKRFPPEEHGDLSNAEVYNETLERITEEDLQSITEDELEVIAIKKELDKAYALTPQIVKNENVTPEEFARVAENLDDLPGINATTDWNRTYPHGETIRSLLGSITTQEEGIPAEKEQYYLTRGYSRNDRVGKSGLEEYYEDLLRGRKEQIQYTTTKNGKVIDVETVVKGERGKDLVLTIDLEFQKEVDKIVREELKTAIQKFPYQNRYLTDALAVVLNPNTGEVLAVSGQHFDREDNEYRNEAFRVLYDAHRPGSTIKGATVLSGYESGVISPGQVFQDRTIQIAGTPPKSSWRTLGAVNDYDALRMSSNVYMFYIALRMGGDYRYPYPNGSPVNISTAQLQEGFRKMRNYFHQFGLGTETGIDFPYEELGYVGNDPLAGNLLDLAIGQYDTYTTMQLAQYVSTIANGGYRIEPHFLKEVRTPDPENDGVGPIYKTKDTKVLNRIEMDYIERVQEGFRRAFQSPGGTAYSFFSNKDYNPAGKTGTAQNEIWENGVKIDTQNLTLVGYAPFDDPEVAFAIVVPHLGNVTGQHPISNRIGERILDTYFELKEKGSISDSEEEEDTEE